MILIQFISPTQILIRAAKVIYEIIWNLFVFCHKCKNVFRLFCFFLNFVFIFFIIIWRPFVSKKDIGFRLIINFVIKRHRETA